jgi:hypothetical protein
MKQSLKARLAQHHIVKLDGRKTLGWVSFNPTYRPEKSSYLLLAEF